MSNASRGAYFKARTRKWLLAEKWQVVDLEVIRWVYRPGGKPIPVKRDQMGADLMAVSGTRLVFIQVKGGQQCVGNGQFPAARREFDKYVVPPFAERWIVAWAPRATRPRIIECSVNGGL